MKTVNNFNCELDEHILEMLFFLTDIFLSYSQEWINDERLEEFLRLDLLLKAWRNNLRLNFLRDAQSGLKGMFIGKGTIYPNWPRD